MTRDRLPSRIVLTLFILLLGLSSGCGKAPQGLEPEKLTLFTPETQLGPCGGTLTNAIRVELISKQIPGLLGGSGTRYPIAGERIRIVPVDPASGIQAIPSAGTTDKGGVFLCNVKLGKDFGDQYLDIVCDSSPEVHKHVRFVAGVTMENNRQEVRAGDALAQPFRIRLTDADGLPMADEPIYFTLINQPGKGGKVTQPLVKTDTNGLAEVGLRTTTGATGAYTVRAEIANTRKHVFTRSFTLEAMSLSIPGLLVSILGGLALFIFGMTLMSEGLQQVAGSKMKSALTYITRNRATAILAGTVVTSLIQSSSATTVMTVGFVNAGLLSLKQAIGVVFGANIGTTITGQMVSFKLDGLALPAIILGVVAILLARKTTTQGIARTILGFGLLFFGMSLMSTQLKNASSFPSFVTFFQTFDCEPRAGGAMPVGAVLGAIGIGTLMTMVVQSSSATIGLTIALANSGLLNFWTAVPIVLGDNIGTTITAILASLNANRTAKQTAAAHSIFNILGTGVMVLLFYIHYHGIPCFLYLVDNITAGDAFQGENLGRHVAMAHSLFNVTNVVVLTPFIPFLVWICEHVIPGKRIPVRVVRLETHLLNTPQLALVCAMNALADMTEKSWKASLKALHGYRDGSPASVEDIRATEDEVDHTQGEIMNYLVLLTRKELTEAQAQAVPVLMHCVNDAERISDLAFLIARRAAGQPVSNAKFTDEAINEMRQILEKASTIANLTLESLRGGGGASKAVAVLMQDMKALTRNSIQGHVDRLQDGICKPERGMIYVEVIAAVENIVRHLENIAQRSDQLAAAT